MTNTKISKLGKYFKDTQIDFCFFAGKQTIKSKWLNVLQTDNVEQLGCFQLKISMAPQSSFIAFLINCLMHKLQQETKIY